MTSERQSFSLQIQEVSCLSKGMWRLPLILFAGGRAGSHVVKLFLSYANASFRLTCLYLIFARIASFSLCVLLARALLQTSMRWVATPSTIRHGDPFNPFKTLDGQFQSYNSRGPTTKDGQRPSARHNVT
ncbi:hypothetical protein J6590_090031 [Homalodisca vitripennis]|nr:hypothetical protein J6590_090031 [Homalodisca vitripennis]